VECRFGPTLIAGASYAVTTPVAGRRCAFEIGGDGVEAFEIGASIAAHLRMDASSFAERRT
jgi:hypothetical protein